MPDGHTSVRPTRKKGATMPIRLDDITSAQNQAILKKQYSPKFFDAKLTGVGKKSGLLNEYINPVNLPPNVTLTTTSENLYPRKRKYTNGNVTTLLIPLSPLMYETWDYMEEIPGFITGKPVNVGSSSRNNALNCTLWMDMQLHSLVIEETVATGSPITRKVTPCYQMFFYREEHTATNAKPGYTRTNTPWLFKRNANATSMFDTQFTTNPYNALDHVIQSMIGVYDVINETDAKNYIDGYSVYDGAVERSKEWQTSIDRTIDRFLTNLSAHHVQNTLNINQETLVTAVLRNLENYNVPLDLYKNIYASLCKNLPNDSARLCKQNLNLLLSDTLHNLNQNKPNLEHITTPANMTLPANFGFFSPEQKNAITCTDPLILIQAGAGSGKSTTILGRIDYMLATGVPAHDITVLSFTNAAANHITDKNPNVHSMTIARMIHTIYEANFKGHNLSNIDTLINSLEIYFHNDPLANKFRNRLHAVVKNDSGAFTNLNNFVEENYDAVIGYLNTVRQTSLELEIIICYQKIDTFVEPPEIQSRFLIIDEVQDNSIFEFVYALKYAEKHKESLFLVGDCSQTLYEFRASNPRALNVLEGSGVFTTFQLNVNYRSNQEILDFANVLLQTIEANQYANIQLQANNLTPVTQQSFTDRVHFHYEQLSKISEFKDALGTLLATAAKKYLDGKLNNNEKVCVLAYTRQHVRIAEDTLRKLYPNKKILSIVPEKMHNLTVFSNFIRLHWNEIKFASTQNITITIGQSIVDHIDQLTYNSKTMLVPVQTMIGDWRAQYNNTITAWQKQYQVGRMSLDDFMANVKETMLDYEIQHNAVKQSLLASRNELKKKSQEVNDADILLSTIHSAKGLEFENVVVVFRNDSNMEEADKRMYYVALTRAMKSEYILAYDTAKSPKIEDDYNLIVETLGKKNPVVPLPSIPTAVPVTSADTAITSAANNMDTDDDDNLPFN